MSVPPLVASSYTLSGNRPFDGPFAASPRDLRSRIEAAAKVGYRGIGVDCLDLDAVVSHYGHGAIREMLAAMVWTSSRSKERAIG